MAKDTSKMDFIQEKVTPAVTKFVNLKFIKCMQAGIVACMNATMIGSIFMLLMTRTIPARFNMGDCESLERIFCGQCGMAESWLSDRPECSRLLYFNRYGHCCM